MTEKRISASRYQLSTLNHQLLQRRAQPNRYPDFGLDLVPAFPSAPHYGTGQWLWGTRNPLQWRNRPRFSRGSLAFDCNYWRATARRFQRTISCYATTGELPRINCRKLFRFPCSRNPRRTANRHEFTRMRLIISRDELVRRTHRLVTRPALPKALFWALRIRVHSCPFVVELNSYHFRTTRAFSDFTARLRLLR